MSTLGKTITLYLMDGTATGRWRATLSQWNGQVYKIPHGDLKDCNDTTILRTPGVYFLFGRDDVSDSQFIYVGEADDVVKRLLQPHTFEKDGSYWTEAIIYVTPDGTLEKGRVKYLENRFYTIATEAQRYIVKNGNTPTQSQIPQDVRDSLEYAIQNVMLIMPALGHLVFESMPSSDNEAPTNDDLLYFSRNHGKSCNALGKVTSDGFWVLKGSYINPDAASYLPSGIVKARKKYAKKIGKDGRLAVDICFGSPSTAATFVSGKNTNGLTAWKNRDGVTLKNLDEGNNVEPATTAKPEPNHGKRVEKHDLLHLAGKKASATGYITEDGFVVCKGSGFAAIEAASCHQWIRDKRAMLIQNGRVVNGIFTQDVLFASPSAAAGCVRGTSSNGMTSWIYEDGQSLKDRQTDN